MSSTFDTLLLDSETSSPVVEVDSCSPVLEEPHEVSIAPVVDISLTFTQLGSLGSSIIPEGTFIMASSYPTISGSVETDSIFQSVVSDLFIPIQNRHPVAT